MGDDFKKKQPHMVLIHKNRKMKSKNFSFLTVGMPHLARINELEAGLMALKAKEQSLLKFFGPQKGSL